MKYGSSDVPKHYKCEECGRKGVKLWREYQTFLDQQTLLCANCALKRAQAGNSSLEYIGPVDAEGMVLCRFTKHETVGQKVDQLGWMVPAVPTEEEDTYWGYTSVPQAGVNWWKRLPT